MSHTNLTKELQELTAEEIYDLAPNFSPSEMISATETLSENLKLEALYCGLCEREQAEAMGSAISLKQLQFLLKVTEGFDYDERWRLSALLVGVPHPLFCALLRTVPPPLLQVLKDQSLSEALPYHLTLILHEIDSSWKQKSDFIFEIGIAIDSLNPMDLDRSALQDVLLQIEQARESVNENLTLLNLAIALAWNTGREDLIEELTKCKEQFVKNLLKRIGRQDPTSGLFSHLNTHLGKAFDDPNSPHLASFKDEEPSIEAFTKWSIWYLEDYWELGLLPQIKDKSELWLSCTNYCPTESLEHREDLLNIIRSNLSHLCLETVSDLKTNQIYSRELLKEYIKKNKHLML